MIVGWIAEQVAMNLARQLDDLLAPLVAEGGELTRQYQPGTGVERFYVDGRLRLELYPVEAKTEGTVTQFTRPIRQYT